MSPDSAKQAILKAVDEHDEARITRAALVTVIEETLYSLAELQYDMGFTDGGNSEEDEYELELDLDDIDDDEDQPA